MSELSELIRINKNIEKQNREIIRLLKIIAGEATFVDKSGYVYPEFEEENTEIAEKADGFKSLLDNEICVGEVYFVDDDIYRFSVENNEGRLDNLIGSDDTSYYDLVELISNESIERNQSLDDSTVILTPSSKGNLPETLKLCYEQDAKNVYIPFDQAMELLGAPDTLQKLLKLNFYKSEDDLIEKLFEQE